MPKLVDFDPETKKVRGFYIEGLHPNIPAGAIEISDAQHAAALTISGDKILDPSTGAISAAPAEAPSQAELFERLGRLRYQFEVSGVDVGGVAVPTDQTAIAKISAGLAHNTTWPIAFKVAPGNFVDVDQATLAVIAGAIAAHVEAGYAAERDMAARIAADEFADAAALDAAWSAAIAAI